MYFQVVNKHLLPSNFRYCTQNQMMYQELSAKVDQVSYNTVVNMTKALYHNCNFKRAWDPRNIDEYEKCTKEISASNAKIQENFNSIKLFSINFQGIMVVTFLSVIFASARCGKVELF